MHRGSRSGNPSQAWSDLHNQTSVDVCSTLALHPSLPTKTTATAALSIQPLPIVRDGETGTSGPDSANRDGKYLLSGLRIGILHRVVHHCNSCIASLSDTRLFWDPALARGLGPLIIRAFSTTRSRDASTSDNLSPGCTHFSPSLPLLDAAIQ